jgi:hypothetical protein
LTPYQKPPKAEKSLTIDQQNKRASDWGKNCATAGTDINEGFVLFAQNNPNITITEAHKIAYKGEYISTAKKQQRQAQLIKNEEQKQAKKTK